MEICSEDQDVIMESGEKDRKAKRHGEEEPPTPWYPAAFPADRKEILALLIRPNLPEELSQDFPTDNSN